VWRPIVVDLRVLFPILDDKRTLEKDRSVKKGAGLDDAQLGRAACDYLMARLKPSNGPQPLPPWFQRGAAGSASEEVPAAAPKGAVSADGAAPDGAAADGAAAASTAPVVAAAVLEECQAVVDPLSHDTWAALDRAPCSPELLDAHPWVVAWRAKEADANAVGALRAAAAAAEAAAAAAAAEGVAARAASTADAGASAGAAVEEGVGGQEATRGGGSVAGTRDATAASSAGAAGGTAGATAATGGGKPKGSKVAPASAAAPPNQAKAKLHKAGRVTANVVAATKKTNRVAPSGYK
jgi:hypothetical protein